MNKKKFCGLMVICLCVHMTHVQSCLLVLCQLDTGAVIGENVSLITGCRRVVLGSVRKQAEPTMKSSPVSSTPRHLPHGLCINSSSMLLPCLSFCSEFLQKWTLTWNNSKLFSAMMFHLSNSSSKTHRKFLHY